MNKTQNYELNLPSYENSQDVEVLNENTIKIDTELKNLSDGKVDNSRVLTNVPEGAKFTDTTYTEITTSEIDAGTSSTKRTITGRRIGYMFEKITSMISSAISKLTKSDVGLSNVDNIKQMPISNGVLENYREKLVTLSGTSVTINLSDGNVFTHTISGNTTYSISNAVNSQAHSFTLRLIQSSTTYSIIFPSSITWGDNGIPDLTKPNKRYNLVFITTDGGITWDGMFGGAF